MVCSSRRLQWEEVRLGAAARVKGVLACVSAQRRDRKGENDLSEPILDFLERKQEKINIHVYIHIFSSLPKRVIKTKVGKTQ